MSNSLKVEPVKIDEKLLNKVEHGIWEFPSLHLIVGKIASGKSTFLHNIITRFYEPVFKQNIILFSPTARNDPIMNTLIEGDKIFVHFTEFNNEIAKRVLEVIKEDDDPKSRWLIILDDAMGMIPPTNSREARWFNKWIANFRHEPVECKVSIIISIQKFSSVNNVVRSNLHYIYFTV